MVFAQSEYLAMAEEPIADPITGAQVELAIPAAGLTKGQRLAAAGKDSTSGATISEVVTISDISGAIITVTPALAKSYARESFSLNANVAAATHGESVEELLGAGDASAKFQSFPLRQPPLTYVSAANAEWRGIDARSADQRSVLA